MSHSVLVPAWTSPPTPPHPTPHPPHPSLKTPPQSPFPLSGSQTDSRERGNPIKNWAEEKKKKSMMWWYGKVGGGVGSLGVGGLVGGSGQSVCAESALPNAHQRSIPEFPQGAVMFRRLRALYNGNTHRTENAQWQGSYYWDTRYRGSTQLWMCVTISQSKPVILNLKIWTSLRG